MILRLMCRKILTILLKIHLIETSISLF